VLPMDAARSGRHALAGQERHEERPVVGVGADGPRGQVGRLQVETPGQQRCAKLSSAGGARCGLAKVLDSTLCHCCARPAKVTGKHKTPGQITEDRPR
jgi:hypothetical protein